MPVVCGGDADHPALVEMGKAIPFKRLTCTALGGERSSPGEGGTGVLLLLLLLFALLLLSCCRVVSKGETNMSVGEEQFVGSLLQVNKAPCACSKPAALLGSLARHSKLMVVVDNFFWNNNVILAIYK